MSGEKKEALLIENPSMSKMMTEGFFGNIPHAQALGIEFVFAKPYTASLKIPYKEELVGNPVTGTLHGGVLISLMDSVAGMAVFCSLSSMEPIATLDLRLDYLKPAAIGEAVVAEAECYKLTDTIAFVRGGAYQGSAENPIASFVATFMRASSSKIQGMEAK